MRSWTLLTVSYGSTSADYRYREVLVLTEEQVVVRVHTDLHAKLLRWWMRLLRRPPYQVINVGHGMDALRKLYKYNVGATL